MTTPTNEEFTRFTREDVVYDNDCVENCGKDEPLAYVYRDDSEIVIHESCLYKLKPRERDNYIAIKHVPSGKPTPEQRIDAAVGKSLDEEYELDEPVEMHIEQVEFGKE